MPDTITVDKVLGHDLYAAANVNAYGSDLTTVKKTYSPGQLIGNVYSWIVKDGEVWYEYFLTPYDYNNFNGTFIKHDAAKLSLPDMPGILEEIAAKADQEKRERLGTIPYYIEKYMPWIVGGVVVAVAAPALLKSSNKNVSGMTEDQKNISGLLITAGVIYILSKKKKPADLIIGDPYDGKYLDDQGNDITLHTTAATGSGQGTMSVATGEAGGGAMLIDHIGAFPVIYKQQGSGLISGAY